MSRSARKPISKNPEKPLPLFEKESVLDLLMEMLPIPGLSGFEGNIAAFVTRKLRQAGIPADAIRHDDAQKRSPLLNGGGEVGNLICTFPGTIRGPRRLLMAHLDTVPLCAGTRPAIDKNGEFIRSANPATGLGGDNRSGVCAILNAALTIMKHRLPHPPLTFFFPVQEEVGLFGARFARLSMLKKPALCFNWDGNLPYRLVTGATGAYRIHIDITGLASHAGVAPDKGVSAIAIAGLAIADLNEHGWHGLIRKAAGTGTSNIGVIAGGDATNVVAASTSLKAEARSHDSAFRSQIKTAFETAFAQAAAKIKNSAGVPGRVAIKSDLHYESFNIPENTPTVVEASRAITALGLKPEMHISNGGLDANWMTAHGFPTVTLGAGQQEVHTVAERLHIDSFVTGCRIALALSTASI